MTPSSALRPPTSPEPASGPLRIGVIAPPWFEVPPEAYGGIESMVANLVDGLVGRGHHVTLIGAGRQRTRAQRYLPVYGEPPSPRLGDPLPEVIHAAGAAALVEGLPLDVVHDHSLAGPLLARHGRTPTVVTAHTTVVGEPGDYLERLGRTVAVVALSDAQRRLRPEVNWVATVHNAIDVPSFPFRADKDGYLLFLGRFHPDKGAHLAIDAARAAGRRLVLAGKCSEPGEKAYFEGAILPRLGRDVEYVGEAGASAKRELYAGAAALLFPICWEEPFGMVVIEALACGTPVVALRRGSVPELLDQGRTGVVVDDPDDLVAAIRVAEHLDPAACRASAEARFDTPVMAAAYEAVYAAVGAADAPSGVVPAARVVAAGVLAGAGDAVSAGSDLLPA